MVAYNSDLIYEMETLVAIPSSKVLSNVRAYHEEFRASAGGCATYGRPLNDQQHPIAELVSTFVPAESSPSLSVVSVTIIIEEANKARVTCRYPVLNVEPLDENLRHCVLPLFLFLSRK